MYFKRLEMQGFKSFAEPAVIEFHEGVTCIVGPNGSGKSNISDAIRWVLGEQSPKMLRGGKMEEVIFSGTASRKSRGMAEVTLVIDNSAGILPIDYNEVAITRRMYRSGESEYLINNNQCRLRDIRELIMDTGIGVEGYSIIGQGKISEIVSSKPESRREIFEEAAGVVMYKSKKAESERKLASAGANLERVNDIIGEIEGRIDGLKEDSQKAEEYLKLKERFRELEINITLKSIEKLEESNSTAAEDIKSLSSEIEVLAEQKRQLDEKLGTSRKKNDTLEELGNKAKDRLVASVEEISGLTGKSRLDEEKINTLERDIVRVEEEIRVLNVRENSESAEFSELSERLDQAEKKLAEAGKALNEKIEASGDINSRLACVIADIDENRNKMYEMHSLEASKRSEARSMESYRESLSDRKKQLVEERSNIEESIAASQDELESAGKELSHIYDQIKKINDEKEATLIQRSAAEKKFAEISEKSAHLKINAGRLSARKKTIEEMENNYEGYNSAVKFVMKNRMKGIRGVAADLITVPRGLEIAVETAMGASLQNVVCEKDNDAKAAIQVLKDNRAGRLTFLPLESVRGNRMDVPGMVTSSAGYRGLACDLIEYDMEYEGIFRYLLGRVAIVDTMQDAIDLSKKASLRFVTLEGEVVNQGGAITGGKYKNRTANLLERKSEIKSLQDELAANQEQLLILQKEGEELHDSIEKFNLNLSTIDENFKELQLSSFDLESRKKNAAGSFEELNSKLNINRQRASAVEDDMKKAVSMTEELEQQADECREEAEKAKAEIERLMEIHDQIKDQAEDASEIITSKRIEKNKWEESRNSINLLLDKSRSSISDIQRQISEKHLIIQEFISQKNDIIAGAEDIAGHLKEKNQEKIKLEEYIAQLSEQRKSLADEIETMTSDRETIADQLNFYQDQKYRQEIKTAKNDTQLETLKDKLWEDFEVSYVQAMGFKKEDFVMSSAQKESREIKNRIKELGDVNVGAIAEYAQVSERYDFLTAQRSDITEAMEQLAAIVDDMEKTIKAKFKENFDKVVVNFEEIFKQLFGGGHAELRLDNEEDPLEAGIEIVAQPPGKKLQNINLMSGGEKTMTAIALMFAVLKTRPTPFCILDEVEAALDDNNIDRFSSYLRNFHDIQFAIVTHQKATMEHADVLYGVTMPEQGVSKVLSLRMGDDFQL